MSAAAQLPPREELQRELEVGLAPALDWMERYLAIFLGRRPRHVAGDKRRDLLHAWAAQLVEFFYELAAVADDPDPHRLERYALDMTTKFGTESVSDDRARPAPQEDWAEAAAKMAAPLKGWPNRSPWRYRERHRHYRAFLTRIVQRGAFENALSFLNETVESGLLPQFQKAMTGQFLPEALRYAPRRLTAAVLHQQMQAWQAVCADWDRLTRIPFGLLAVSRGHTATWEKTGTTDLGNRVRDHLLRDPDLAPLVRHDWVMIRNAMQHGTWLYDPQMDRVEFSDRQRPMILPACQVRQHAIDMALSNWAITMTHGILLDAAYDPIRLVHPMGAKWPLDDAASASARDIVQPAGD